jgi:hypothetical protein
MARPQRHNVDYFPHYISDGKKMFIIESKFGNDGYAAWFKILETLAKTDDHWIDLNEESNLMYLAAKCRVSDSLLIEIIESVVKLGELDAEFWYAEKVVWCQKFIESIDDAYRKRGNPCMTKEGLRQHLWSLGRKIGGLSGSKGGENPQSKEENSKEDINKPDLFQVFWNLYGNKIEEVKCQREWFSIDHAEYPKIIEHVPKFVNASGKFLCKPLNYLEGRRWKDEQLPNYALKEEPKKERFIPTPPKL